MVGRIVSFWGPAYFQGRAVSFREGRCFCFNDFLCVPVLLGKWSNLTSIFFKWVCFNTFRNSDTLFTQKGWRHWCCLKISFCKKKLWIRLFKLGFGKFDTNLCPQIIKSNGWFNHQLVKGEETMEAFAPCFSWFPGGSFSKLNRIHLFITYFDQVFFDVFLNKQFNGLD